MKDFKKIEEKWQDKWEKEKIFETNPEEGRKKFFINVPYPYVNGAPHIGTGFTYLRADAYARFKRMQGFNVLFPQGFHATGEPILGVVERIRKGDKSQIEGLKLFGASDEDIENFAKEGPEFVANYWREKWTDVMKSVGYSADWRRSFITAMTPAYNQFIQWQYRKLKKKGYVVQGTHPVVWCPHDESPTGDHDRLVGVGESISEFVAIKFKLESGEIMPCATMRPETVFGATNIWMNPREEYVKAKVDGENWIIGRKSAEKLLDQMHSVENVEGVNIFDFIGKMAKNPITGTDVPVLPASFVDGSVATGVVMSVPSHAPYDWMGLHELKENYDFAKRFGLSREFLEKVAPISIISVDGMGENPAIEIVESMLITSQSEREKLDEATSEVYKKEFHGGIMKDDTDYAGVKVSEAKEKITNDLVKKGSAFKFWETTGEVMCRCKTGCHVKILENQWFLKFSDKKWKDNVKKAIRSMNFYPEVSRLQFLNTVDWLKDKACARKSGLGTKLPWDEEWIVETLSDSVIYMAYYTISHIINQKKIPAEDLTDEIFDYIFLGKKPKKSKIDSKVLEKMRKEFKYFYPVDLRLSGKDLLQNHLTFFLFHHTAIWDKPEMWPRGIGVNGYVTLGGEKMSKSKGNVRLLKDVIKEYGADVSRLNLVGSNEGMDDANWREDMVESFSSRIIFLQRLAEEVKLAGRKDRRNIDKFALSRMQKIIASSTEACECLRFRSALQHSMFESISEIKWYIDRCGGIENCRKDVLKEMLSIVVRLLGPFMPHFAEEIWSRMGKKELVSISSWPEADEKLVDKKSEMGEEMVKKVIEDVREIKKIAGIEKPKRVVLIVPPQWKFDVYQTILKNKGKDFKEILGMLKEKNKDVVKYVQTTSRKAEELRDDVLNRKEQFRVLDEGKDFIGMQLSSEIEIQDAETSDLPKARNADVQKVAIFVA